MYNIIKHLNEIFVRLEAQGYMYEIPKKLFMAELKRSTSVFNEKTLGKWIRSFVEMGYIRLKNPFVFERCISFDKPYLFGDGKDYNGVDQMSEDKIVVKDDKK